jgi:hypothetical protein
VATLLTLVDRLADERSAQVSFMRLAYGMRRRDDRDSLVQGDLIGLQVFVVEPIAGRHFPADPVAAGNGDVNSGWVDIAQLI